MSEVSEKILDHLGGASFVEATSAYAWVRGDRALSFIAPGAKQGYRSVHIELRPDETYEMRFSRGRGPGDTITRKEIPAGKLAETFTKVTGQPTKKKEAGS